MNAEDYVQIPVCCGDRTSYHWQDLEMMTCLVSMVACGHVQIFRMEGL